MLARLLILSIFMTSSLVYSQEKCAVLLQYDRYNHSFESVSQSKVGQVLLSVMPRVSEKIWKRYWNSTEVNKIAQNVLFDLSGQSHSFEIDGQGWMLTRSLKMEGHLFLDLVHIQIRDADSRVAVGQRSQGANSLFLKAMGGFLKAAFTLKSENPEIQSVVIRGVNIKNPMLLEFLAENGFKRNDLHVYSKEMEKEIVFLEN